MSKSTKPAEREMDKAQEPMPFDDALRILLAAPPQHRTAKDKADKVAGKPKASKGAQSKT
jgi:hypothetical protein